jgi:hypothetical protein
MKMFVCGEGIINLWHSLCDTSNGLSVMRTISSEISRSWETLGHDGAMMGQEHQLSISTDAALQPVREESDQDSS